MTYFLNDTFPLALKLLAALSLFDLLSIQLESEFQRLRLKSFVKTFGSIKGKNLLI